MFQLSWVADLMVILISLTSLLLLVLTDPRTSLGILAVQYLGVFFLVAQESPLALSIVKLIAGWVSCTVLGIAIINLTDQTFSDTLAEIRARRLSRFFYGLAALVVALVLSTRLPSVTAWIPNLSRPLALAGIFLIGMGLLKLGFSSKPLPVTLALLTAMAGFEILYAAVVTSLLLSGLLAGVNLGIAFAGAYLLLAPTMPETE
jgi:hypothetical protein